MDGAIDLLNKLKSSDSGQGIFDVILTVDIDIINDFTDKHKK